MWQGGYTPISDKKEEDNFFETYGDLGASEQTAMNRRLADATLTSDLSSERATDNPMLARAQQELSSNVDGRSIQQLIEEAQKAIQKWNKRSLRIMELSPQDGEGLLKETTGDIEYWLEQGNKASLLIEKNKATGEQNTELLECLVKVAREAVNAANAVAKAYIPTIDHQQSKSASLVGQPLNLENAKQTKKETSLRGKISYQGGIITDDQQEDEVQRMGLRKGSFNTTAMSIPALNKPIEATMREDILESWAPGAEIRYDKSTGKYVSNNVSPTGILQTIVRTLSRTLKERAQSREAVNKISQSYGPEKGARFQQCFSVRLKKTMGSPLTPSLIKAIEYDLNQEDQRSQGESELISSIHEIEKFFAEWEWERNTAERTREHPYNRIPNNGRK